MAHDQKEFQSNVPGDGYKEFQPYIPNDPFTDDLLENETVQTTGAAGESIAAGIIFTFPALTYLWFTLDVTKVFVVTLAGGSLGAF